jgi:ACT domain-containing protein
LTIVKIEGSAGREPCLSPAVGRNMAATMNSNRFIVTVIGCDRTGIVAKVATVMTDYSVNIVDISQTIMQDIFTMIMLVQSPKDGFDLADFQGAMDSAAKELGVEVKVQHEDAFRYMHRI